MMKHILRHNTIFFLYIILNNFFLIRRTFRLWCVWYKNFSKYSNYVFVLGLIVNCNYLVMNNYTKSFNNE